MLSIAVAYAQEAETTTHSDPKIAVRIGCNASTVHGAEFEGKWKPGINTGITADFCITDSWAIRPGLYYTRKGFGEGASSDITYKSQLDYLEMPVLAVYKKSAGQKCALELQAGPYFSYGIAGKADYRKLMYGECHYYKSFDMFKHFDWGANVGIGLEIDKLYIGASYDFGFVSIIRHALNHCIMANVGYRIM